MEDINIVKGVGALGITALSYVFGSMDKLFIALVVFLVFDYISGIISAVMSKTLSSKIGFQGILKKLCFLIVVGVAHILDGVLGTEGTARALVIGFLIANEGISILENLGKIGVPIPEKLMDMLQQLKE